MAHVYGRIEDSDLIDGLDIRYLKYSGLWGIINYYREFGRKSIVFKFWMLVSIVVFSPMSLLSIIGPFVMETNIEGITKMILTPIVGVQAALKFAILWKGIDEQCQLMDLLKKGFLKIPPEFENVASRMIAEAAQMASSFANIGAGADIATAVAWDMSPLVSAPTKGPNKILGFWYPFDFVSSPGAQIVFVIEVVVSTWFAFIILLIQGVLMQQLLLLIAYIRIYSYMLSNANLSDAEELLVYTKQHQSLLRTTEQLSSYYSALITCQMATGLIILIITIFNFFMTTGDTNPFQMAKFMICFGYTVIEVTLYCYLGSELESASQDVGFAAYCTPWFERGVSFRRMILMMINRSKRPITLIFANSYPVNLIMLMNIMQMSYSTSMMLFEFTKDHNL